MINSIRVSMAQLGLMRSGQGQAHLDLGSLTLGTDKV